MFHVHSRSIRTALAVVAVASATLTPGKALAQCPQTELIAGLQQPLGLALSNRGNLIVAETGVYGVLHSGRVSIVGLDGSRRTLLDGLPAAVNDVNEMSGPAGVFVRGRTIYVAIGIGNSILPGPAPGSALPNPAVASPIFSSILAIHLSADAEQQTTGATLLPAHHAQLAAGQPVTLPTAGGGKIVVQLVANFPDYTPAFRPDVPANVRGSNPFDLVAIDDQLYVTDGGQNAVRQVDMPTGTFWTLATFPVIGNPLFPNVGGPFVEAVPTGIREWRGSLLVSLFRGFPFPAGQSSIVSVNPLTGSVSPSITGLTSSIDVQPATDRGALAYLVLEHATGNIWSGPGQLTQLAAAAAPVPVAGCLARPTSMALDPKSGAIYVTELVGGRIVVIRP